MKLYFVLISFLLIPHWLSCAVDKYPLHRAILENNFGLAQELVKCDPSLVLTKDAKHRTPLLIAAQQGYTSFIEMLTANGALVYQVYQYGITPLHEAVANGHIQAARMLIDKGAFVDAPARCRWTSQHKTEANESTRATRLLINHAITNASAQFGWTPMHIAVTKGNVRMVSLLIGKKATVNVCEKNKTTFLHLAMAFGQDPEMLKLFINAGADVNCWDMAGRTPLHYCLSPECTTYFPQNILPYINVLLDAPKINKHAKDSKGRTPLQHALDEKLDNSIALELECHHMKHYLNKARFAFLLCMRRTNEKPFELINNNIFLLQEICSHLTVAACKNDKGLIQKCDDMYQKWLAQKNVLSAVQQNHSKPSSALQKRTCRSNIQ